MRPINNTAHNANNIAFLALGPQSCEIMVIGFNENWNRPLGFGKYGC